MSSNGEQKRSQIFQSSCRWTGGTSLNLRYTFISDFCRLKQSKSSVAYAGEAGTAEIDAPCATPAAKDRSKTVTESHKYTCDTWKGG
jgi:hypothetical protein